MPNHSAKAAKTLKQSTSTALPLYNYDVVIHKEYLAEAVRFELTVPFDTLVFKTNAISRALPRFHKLVLCSLAENSRYGLRSMLDIIQRLSRHSIKRCCAFLVEEVGLEPTMPEAEDLQSPGVTNFPTLPKTTG